MGAHYEEFKEWAKSQEASQDGPMGDKYWGEKDWREKQAKALDELDFFTQQRDKLGAEVEALRKEKEQKMYKDKKETALAVQNETTPPGGGFVQYQREAKLLLQSFFLPERFNAPTMSEAQKIANVCVAMEMASHYSKFGALEVMQQIYFINGQPAWKSSFVMALLKSQGLKVIFEEEGDWADKKTNPKTRAVAIDKEGFKYLGTWISWPLVDGEGWAKKSGSKWLTMPAQMARYRAATFLARAYWPELMMGLYTQDERQDFTDGEPEGAYIQQPVERVYNAPASVRKAQDYDYSNGPEVAAWEAAAAAMEG